MAWTLTPRSRSPRLFISFCSLILIISFALNVAPAFSTASAEIDANANLNMRPSFPAHWGHPPRVQTRDLVQLPGEYGRGSGTLRLWILEKMSEDDARNTAAESWPEKDLVGMTGEEAKAAVLSGNPQLLSKNVEVLPHDAIVTEDYREDRVRIFVGGDGKVVRQPSIG